MTSRFHSTFGIVATAIVLTAFVWGIFIVGSPVSGRKQRFDDRRIEDLRAISGEIMNVVYERKPYDPIPTPKPTRPVPASLEEVASQAQYQRLNITDPETGAPYEYNVSSATSYQLCATFSFERRQPYDIFWDHQSGRRCFEFDVTKSDGYAEQRGKFVPANSKPVAAP